ncbi:MAG: FAD-dependent oxidoreductase [Verrucomicrobia bacterium]|nr:FAD-dependent oxidoreductase [Verrucomicrobiota bacterium]
MKIVVVGGSAAGPKAAAKARRMDQHAEITILQEGPDLSMASCGYPYFVGGFFDDRNQLLSTPTGVIRDPKYYLKAKGINAMTRTRVTAIDRKRHVVSCHDLDEEQDFELAYDKLVLATGASPVVPPLPGSDLEGISTLQSMRDADYLRQIADEKKIDRAVVIGGGLIGVETCEALHLAGIQITLVEMMSQLLLFLDWEMAKVLENHIRSKAAIVITENPVAEFLGENGKLTGVKLRNGIELPCELAVVAVGVRPNSKLAEDAGLKIGERGGIEVDTFMQTSDPDIYAAGDCVEIPHLITGEKVHAPFGDLANLEGRVVGQNVVTGNKVEFPGTIQTGVCKVFDYGAGATGLSESRAREAGYNVVSVITAAPDKPHFMGGELLLLKMVANADTGRLLGLQAVGPGDVSKRIAQAAMAIHGKLTVADLVNADLPYAPPFSPAIDNFIMTAHVLENKMLGRMSGLSASEVRERLQKGGQPYLLDVRGADEFERMRLGVGENLIPLGALRNRLNELPADKDQEIICYCKISLRGYEAASVLEANGWTNVKVMEGGLMAWPFPREK